MLRQHSAQVTQMIKMTADLMFYEMKYFEQVTTCFVQFIPN
jgi:hypothetical protein